ncbi:MAG: PLP-dependent aminotransferase family protein [Cohaesibacter sp.]|jgi:GntR family transcriptional regulator/MocR family aminotransferase|nr:PLP-dependent aminotransferase family protein [Cohaesibacter sp.]
MLLAGHVSLDRDGEVALSRQVYGQIRGLIEQGRLSAGVRLPTSRTLAKDLKVGRNTVMSAYEQLVMEGFLEADGRRGTRVSEASRGFEGHGSGDIRDGDGKGETASPRLSVQALEMMQIRRREQPAFHSFQPGLPELRSFPHDLWARHLRRAARQMQLYPDMGGYAHYSGLPALQEAIIEHARLARGVVAEPEQVVVLSSAQAALDLVSRLLLNIGDPAMMEEPGYSGVLASLKGVQADMYPIVLDEEAPFSQLPKSAAPKLIYVTPSHQFPTGRLMGLDERLALLKYASQCDSYVLEDDYDSEFHFKGTPISSLQGLDRQERVIYMGTFSKSLMPALHAAYLIMPPKLVNPTLAMHRNVGSAPALVLQLALASFMQEGQFRAHIRQMCMLYQERQDGLVSALERYCAKTLIPMPQDGGIQLLAMLSDHTKAMGWDDQSLSHYLRSHGIENSPLSGFYWTKDVPRRQGLFFGHAASDLKEIDHQVRQMAALIQPR